MKKTILVLVGSIMALACNQTPKQLETPENKMEQTYQDDLPNPVNNTIRQFNIDSISFSEADLGDFPYFNLPKGLVAQNKPLQKKFDVCFFPIDGVMTAVEGKLYKINVSADQNEEFSQRYFEKSLEDYLVSIGAVKVFDGEISKEEYERYNKQDPNKGDEGDIGYFGEKIKFYVIRSKTKGNIYIQYSANNASGKLNILLEEPLKQTITKLSSDEILKDLSEKGKSILYINFEIDKSNLTFEGREAVDEITKVLKSDPSLKIVIEGHTDNSGDAAHNKNLSTDRAESVMSELISKGIEKTRLVAKGFGAERPLVANDSEENKAKNRRVELIKIS
ncbi:OmpA family protein [Myroides guanonis]|uniref:OmpA family protein n=1 Tax=Myroides guanonis TaxID=1150112 RepID=A0A1I3R8V1_9FLAO|nr:OmpA family protein [Myroides guanonis]SFJ42480.1 OmpA family protein [Myroides guanonis]